MILWRTFKMYFCKQCGETVKEKMMSKGQGRKSKSLCKVCHNKNTIERGRRNRRIYIEYLGGKCVKCNYDKCDSALEFHHRDQSKKDLRFNYIRYWGFEKAKKELNKCDLVCSNCHREIHYDIVYNGDVAQLG